VLHRLTDTDAEICDVGEAIVAQVKVKHFTGNKIVLDYVLLFLLFQWG
jgi:hypothetical protein